MALQKSGSDPGFRTLQKRLALKNAVLVVRLVVGLPPAAENLPGPPRKICLPSSRPTVPATPRAALLAALSEYAFALAAARAGAAHQDIAEAAEDAAAAFSLRGRLGALCRCAACS